MNKGALVFAQVTKHLPLTTFRRYVARYAGHHKVKTFSCLNQYLCMAFAQLTYRESLRDIAVSDLGSDLYLNPTVRLRGVAMGSHLYRLLKN